MKKKNNNLVKGEINMTENKKNYANWVEELRDNCKGFADEYEKLMKAGFIIDHSEFPEEPDRPDWVTSTGLPYFFALIEKYKDEIDKYIS